MLETFEYEGKVYFFNKYLDQTREEKIKEIERLKVEKEALDNRTVEERLDDIERRLGNLEVFGGF